MNEKDWKMIGGVASALGILFLLGGLFAASYYEIRGWLFLYKYYPYAEHSGNLIIIGIVLLVIGSGTLWRAKQETSNQTSIRPEEKKEVILNE